MFDIKYDRDGNVVSSSPVNEPVVEQEIATMVSEESIPEPEIVSEEPAEEVIDPTPISNRERNTRALRELKEQAERERDEAIRRVKDLEHKYSSKQSHSPKEENIDDEYDINIGEDDLAEGKHLKKVTQKIRELEKKVKQYESQSQNNSLQSQIRAEYPDFSKVVTPENIELLKHLKPRQAALLNSSTDLFATASSAYEMIKEYGIYQEQETHYPNKMLAQKNSIKPKSTASISPQQGDSPLSKANAFANGLTPELAAQLRKEMEDIRRRN